MYVVNYRVYWGQAQVVPENNGDLSIQFLEITKKGVILYTHVGYFFSFLS